MTDTKLGWRVRALCEHLESNPKASAADLTGPLKVEFTRQVGASTRKAMEHGLVDHDGINARNTAVKRKYWVVPGWRDKLEKLDAAHEKPDIVKPISSRRVNSVWQLGAA